MKQGIDKGRRRFLEVSGASAAAVSTAAWLGGCNRQDFPAEVVKEYMPSERLRSFREIIKKPIVEQQYLPDPVMIEHIGLYRSGDHQFIRVTSTDGAVGIATAQRGRLENVQAIMINRVIPSLIGADARDIENLVGKVYLARSNYKWQGLAFWVAVAYVEIAILDMLGRVAG